MMDADEREIFFYLRKDRESFVSAGTITRHAGGKHKFRESSDWARAALLRMVERGILELDPTGAYRLRPMPKPDPSAQSPRWVSPQIAELLRKSGKRFDVVVTADMDEETYYDSL
jgi:hypothetical protein